VSGLESLRSEEDLDPLARMDELLERAEEEEAARIAARTEWAASMEQVRLENAYEGDVIIIIEPTAKEPKLLSAPTHEGFRYLLSSEVLVMENQMVVLQIGMQRSIYNSLASKLACTPVHGTAAFMLVDRFAVRSHLHELHYFDKELWDNWVKYVELAHKSATFFGGSEPWQMRIHWTALEREQREPFVLTRAEMAVVAQPKVIANEAFMNEAFTPGEGKNEL